MRQELERECEMEKEKQNLLMAIIQAKLKERKKMEVSLLI